MDKNLIDETRLADYHDELMTDVISPIMSDLRAAGVTANRPAGSDIYVGFQYFDTTLGKPIYASAISGDTVTWVDATGTSV